MYLYCNTYSHGMYAYRMSLDVLACFGPPLSNIGYQDVRGSPSARPERPALSTRVTLTSSNVVTEGGPRHLHEYLLMSDQRADDDPSTLSTNNTDPLVPIYTDKTPIQWDGNPAHIAGCMFDVGKFYKRTGLFHDRRGTHGGLARHRDRLSA